MIRSLPRRKRHIAVTTFIAGALVLAGGVVTWFVLAPGQVYRPGEAIAGLTSDLDRELPPDYPHVTFIDATTEAGITFEHFAAPRTSQLPEDMGSGAAWGDFDTDGWLDLYVVNMAGNLEATVEELRTSQAHSTLYRNNRDGTFTDVSSQAGVDLRSYGMAAAWGDYDKDGWADLVVTSYGRIVLYRNRGDGTFEDMSSPTGIGAEEGFWSGASWSDYDRDGLLDLYVTGYVKYSGTAGGEASVQYDVVTPASLNPSSFEPERNLLFHNTGDGRFEEVALRTGVQNSEGRSLSAAWTDLDQDGWPDLYVANDVSDNALYRNLGDGTFEDVSHQALVADYRGAMGIAVGDWDGDLDTDLFLTHWIAQENALYANTRSDRIRKSGIPGILQFMDVADRFGLGQIALDYIGWGTSFIDYDNDGRLDLFVVNGSTFQRNEDFRRLVPMKSQLFWNRNSQEGFYDVSSAAGPYFEESNVGRGAAFGDYDNDGDVDAFVVNHGGAGALLRNDGGNENSWLAVALRGVESNRSAFGTRIRVVSDSLVSVREVGAQASYCSQNSPVVHFGLGRSSRVDTLEITWPSGLVEILLDVAPNQILRLVEGETLAS
ncbi:MAG TPA: CRTAC1 family protein [Rhodothermales bacterium]|nr:CRTAC1 family protein [Rhodothermales bacterium]